MKKIFVSILILMLSYVTMAEDYKLYEALWCAFHYMDDWDCDGERTARDAAFIVCEAYKALGGEKDIRIAKYYLNKKTTKVFVVYDNCIDIEPGAVSCFPFAVELGRNYAIRELSNGIIKYKMEDCWKENTSRAYKDAMSRPEWKDFVRWDRSILDKSDIYDSEKFHEEVMSLIMWHGTSKNKYRDGYGDWWPPFDWDKYNRMIHSIKMRNNKW